MKAGFPPELQDAVWHTTRPDRYERIQRDGQIVANPDLPDSERWKTGNGPDTYPYVRTLSGVSLFEFKTFDPISYSEKYPVSMWRNFVPCCVKWDTSIWLEIDVSGLGEHYISARKQGRTPFLGQRRHKENLNMIKKVCVPEVSQKGVRP